MGPKKSTCKSGLAVKPDVVKSEKINIIKAYKPIRFWDLSIMVAKSEMLLNQVPIRQ